MRNYFFLLVSLIFNAHLLFGQIKAYKPQSEQKDKIRFYAGFDYGSATNHGSFAKLVLSNSGDVRMGKQLSIDASYAMAHLTLGAKYKRHAVEIGYGSLAHHTGGSYTVETSPEKEATAGFNIIRTMGYVPLRYSYQLFNLTPRVSVSIGAGVGFAFFLDDGRDEFSEPMDRTIVTYYSNGTSFLTRQLTDEEQLKRSTITYELNGRLNWQIGKRLGFNLAGSYIYSPQVIRKHDFLIAPQVGKPHTGTIFSNLNSTALSLGINYYILNPPNPTEKQKKESVENKNRFYVATDLGYFLNTGNFKGSVSSGTLKPSIWPWVTERRLALNVGYKMSRYAFELSYQKLSIFNSFIYDEVQYEPGTYPVVLGRQSTGALSQYLALRLYRNLLKNSKKWQLNVGIGVAFAKFEEEQVSEVFREKTIYSDVIGDANDPKKIVVNYSDVEKLKASTVCIEGNFKAERKLNERWQINFWSRYIYNPEVIRTVKFNVNYNKGASRNGEVTTNLTGFAVGTGLQFNF